MFKTKKSRKEFIITLSLRLFPSLFFMLGNCRGGMSKLQAELSFFYSCCVFLLRTGNLWKTSERLQRYHIR